MNQQNHTDITGYLSTLNHRFSAGNASEHTYRKDLEDLLIALLPDIEVTNEPSKVTDCGNPGYLLSQKSIPVGFYEAVNETCGKVWINDTQYFDKVPKSTWEFYIGGYQPAQKWLKDRVGRTLSYDDIVHYQRMILAMNKTKEIMQLIDKV